MGQMNEPCLSKAGMEKALKELLGVGYSNKVEQIINDNFIGWYSRSMAVAMFVFAKNKEGKWCVLANKRGVGCPDFVGHWCATCGYLDFNETIEEGAVRELHEECGLVLSPSEITFVGYESDPVRANRQNVTFRFAKVFQNEVKSWQMVWPIKYLFKKKINSVVWSDNIKTNRNHCEENEVDEIKWIPIERIDFYPWAFGHEVTIKEVAKKFGLI